MTPGGAVLGTVVAAWATTVPGASAPASAAAPCADGRGVRVVVESGPLDGPDLSRCDPGGGGLSAARLLARQGLALTYVQRQPGFLCRLDGRPVDDPCLTTPPGDAYWSLWWTDGTATGWTYASVGVDGLEVPDGGAVALTWDDEAGDVRPTSPAAGTSGPGAGDEAGSAADGPAAGPDDAGLPVWVAPGAVALLLGAAAGTAVVRRRRAGART